MKGENEFQAAYENHKKTIEADPDSYFGVSPWKRIFTCFMGPFFNLLFTAVLLSAIWGAGIKINTYENRIVLLSDITGEINPADIAGLKSGDRILEIAGKPTPYYHDIRENIALNANVNLSVLVERDGQLLTLTARPMLDKSSGAGILGVYPWETPVIGKVLPGSLAEAAGLMAGDRIISINGTALPHTAALSLLFDDDPAFLLIEFEREMSVFSCGITPVYSEKGMEPLGFYWQGVQYKTPRLNPAAALVKGVTEGVKTFSASIKSLALLFQGIDLTQAVSGPFRITYMLGEYASEGFTESFGLGLSSMANFLALISTALCIMNLLPLPVIDGGMIVLYLIEGIRRKPTNPRAIYIYQSIGVVIIFGLMIFALYGDILYFLRLR